MKKKILTLILAILLIMPLSVFAEEKNVSLNLKETLAEEEIELQNKDYKETDNQITIYLFRGRGCSFCQGFLKYLNTLTVEHGDKFKLVSYDVWNHNSNAELYEEVAEFLEYDVSGVPFIVIGDKVFSGYAEGYNEGILDAILNEYKKKEMYDVIDELEKHKKEVAIKEFVEKVVFAAVVSLVVSGITSAVIICYTNKKNKEMAKRIEKLEKKLMEENKAKKDNKETHKKDK